MVLRGVACSASVLPRLPEVWAPPPRPGHRPPVDDPDFGDGQDFSGWVPGYSLSPAVEAGPQTLLLRPMRRVVAIVAQAR